MAARGQDRADGWLANARRLRSPNFDARPTGVVVDLVVMHAISLPPGEFGGPYIDQLFTNCLAPNAHPYFAEIHALRASAHFVITRTGELTQFVSAHDRAWHAGESRWQGRECCNDYSVGIEFEGCDDLPFADAQYVAAGALFKQLQTLLPMLTPARIVGHSDIAPIRKTDPGPYFDWARLRRSLLP